MKSFYVDDWLHSVISIDTGVQLVYSVKAVLQDNGFHLIKYIANDTALLINVPVVDINYVYDNHIVPLAESKIMWCVRKDCFLF